MQKTQNTMPALKKARTQCLLPLRQAADLALGSTQLKSGNSRYVTFCKLQSAEGEGSATDKKHLQAALTLLQDRKVDPRDFIGTPSAENVRRLRFYLDLTLTEVALLMGKKSQLTVLYWEQGTTPIPRVYFDQLCAAVSETQHEILIRIYGSAERIPRHRRGARLTVVRQKPSRRTSQMPLALVTGTELGALRVTASLSVSAVATLVFPEILDADTALRALERRKKVATEKADAIQVAIKALLVSRHALMSEIDDLGRTPENLRTLRHAFGLSQTELGRLLGARDTRGTVCTYESESACRKIPGKRWQLMKTRLTALDKACAKKIAVALAERRLGQ